MVSAGRYTFAPRALPTLAAVAFIALTVALGRWQAHRADEKLQRQALYEARMHEAPVRLTGAVDSAEPLLFRRVSAAGRWIAERQVFVDNQVLDGPRRLRGGDAVAARGLRRHGAREPRMDRARRELPAPAACGGPVGRGGSVGPRHRAARAVHRAVLDR